MQLCIAKCSTESSLGEVDSKIDQQHISIAFNKDMPKALVIELCIPKRKLRPSGAVKWQRPTGGLRIELLHLF